MRQLGGGFNPKLPANWRQTKAYSGNNIMALGIWNETIHRYAGFEKSVSAWGRVFVPERRDPETDDTVAVDIPDSVGIAAEMESGATAVYHLSGNCCVASGPELLIYGTRGGIRLADGQAWIARRGVKEWLPLEIPEGKEGGWRVERDFVDSIRDGKPVTRTSFEDGVKYMAFTEAVHRSLAEGKRIDMSTL
jgi:predicted dehydrogenase